MRKPAKQKPPYKTALLVPVGSSTVRVKLPPASEYDIGARTEVKAEYKGMPMRIKLIRCEGGWDLES